MNAIEKRLIQNLVDSGVIPQSALQFGEHFVLRRIKRSFDPVARLETINPDRIVGEKLAQLRLPMCQDAFLRTINEQLVVVGAKPIGSRSSLSRIETGTYSLDYKVGLAAAHILHLPPDAFSPWDWNDSFAPIREPQEPHRTEAH